MIEYIVFGASVVIGMGTFIGIAIAIDRQK